MAVLDAAAVVGATLDAAASSDLAAASWKRAPINLPWLDQDDDPRVGANRNGSGDQGTLSSLNGSQGSSLSKLGSTFIPVVIYLTVCLLVFIFLRRRVPRVYAPRTFRVLRYPEATISALPNGWFDWIKPLFKTPDSTLLNQGCLDGFFFLRFIKVLRNICLVGCCIAWPILLPIHATGGRGLSELEILTIGNVVNSKKLYAHAVVAWLLFGFVLFTVCRECIYYINLRQAFLSSPYYSKRLSSRTVLFTSVPQRYLDEARIRKLYGDGVRRVWIPRTSKGLVNLVKEREQTATRLERAEIALICKANQIRNKQIRKGKRAPELETFEKSPALVEEAETSDPNQSPRRPSSTVVSESRPQSSTPLPLPEIQLEGEPILQPLGPDSVDDEKGPEEEAKSIDSQEDDSMYVHPYGLNPKLPDVRGSVAAQYMGADMRPHHRPIGNYLRRVDTIRWTRVRLIELSQRIAKLRKQLRRGGDDKSTTWPAVFVEFETQEAAQAAHQVVAHHQPLHMAPRILGIRPDDIVWSSLRMNWLERIVRRFLILGLVIAAIIFWSIPSVIVGAISNVDSLIKLFPFLSWLGDLPGAITGFLTGFVPAMALTLFMAIVPVLLRFCAVAAGVPSYTRAELFTQTAYFAFQVVQVFLVTTITSAASGALFDILLAPLTIKDVLAANLPKASNFYLSYILIQCLMNAGTSLLHPFDLFRHVFLRKIARLPRMHHRIFYTMKPALWGRDFPIFTNLGVIALCYACIAPLILIFAACGMSVTYIIWRYNILYVYDSSNDSHGLFYPRALIHLVVGLYLAEICLIGLLFLNGGNGPGVLVVLLLIFTALVHYSLANAIYPLIQNLPQTLLLEEEIQQEEKAAAEAAKYRQEHAEENHELHGAASTYFDAEEQFGDWEDDLGNGSDDDDDDESENYHGQQNSRSEPVTQRGLGTEGSSDFRDAFKGLFKDWTKKAAKEQLEWLGVKPPTKEETRPSAVVRWFSPHIHDDFIAIRKDLMDLPASLDDMSGDRRYTYLPPEMWTPKPVLWIPRDEARVSRQEVAHTRKSTPISDRGATLHASGKVTVDVEEAPFALPRLLL
uniref:CSC1/OSCA1-like 7TM region domain-containing protein n=1 Tax=Bionectria ochroleuca TaxID=29856 RepID=A0A8H7K322_BIOOC